MHCKQLSLPGLWSLISMCTLQAIKSGGGDGLGTKLQVTYSDCSSVFVGSYVIGGLNLTFFLAMLVTTGLCRVLVMLYYISELNVSVMWKLQSSAPSI